MDVCVLQMNSDSIKFCYYMKSFEATSELFLEIVLYGLGTKYFVTKLLYYLLYQDIKH